MNRNRLKEMFDHQLPQPATPAAAPDAFFLCPSTAASPSLLTIQQVIYQMAFEQAQAVVRPSLPERDLLAVWN